MPSPLLHNTITAVRASQLTISKSDQQAFSIARAPSIPASPSRDFAKLTNSSFVQLTIAYANECQVV